MISTSKILYNGKLMNYSELPENHKKHIELSIKKTIASSLNKKIIKTIYNKE